MSNNYRGRNWSLVCYLTEEQLLKRLCAIDNIRYYAYICHDKDLCEDGSPKPRHIHLALCLHSARTQAQICGKFTDIESDAGNCFGQPTRSNKSIIEYFTHKNEPEKTQYSDDCILSNNIEYFRQNAEEDNTLCIVEDMLARVPLRKLVKNYGKDFLYHYSQYKSIVEDILIDEN